MPRPTAFLYTDEFLSYNLGGKHPLQQTRLQMVHRLLGAYGLLSPQGPVDWITPTPATPDEILEVHTPDFVEAVQRAGRGEKGDAVSRYGLGPGDTPAFPGMYEAAALYAGGTVDAARLVLSGQYEAAFNVAGGLHHAHPNRASGFCTFNDLALGIHTLLRGGCDRVAYLDIDAHHGDGVQDCFYHDGRVLTISLHESGRYLFPGTGFPGEVGEGDGEGTSLNVPLYPYTEDEVWHAAFDAVVPRALARFAPDAFVLQVGADAHWQDPLAHLQLTSRGWMEAVAKILTLAEGKPVVVTGGGGYNIRTVARLWTMVQAACAEVALPDTVPAAYDALYNLPRLHDTERPVIEEKYRNESRAYAAQQVMELEATGVLG
ncbi:MAG: acetoin utilization protein AcuC [Cytophagales bacterium]|nr:acetoin utilization protein AcuC [Armatimonadota bacterium]